MKLWQKIKNWIIKKLGGYTAEEFTGVNSQSNTWENLYRMGERHLRIAERGIEYWCNKHTALEKTIRTIQVKVDAVNYGPTSQSFEALKARAKKDIISQLTEDIYTHAKHFVTEDGKYICAVKVQEAE